MAHIVYRPKGTYQKRLERYLEAEKIFDVYLDKNQFPGYSFIDDFLFLLIDLRYPMYIESGVLHLPQDLLDRKHGYAPNYYFHEYYVVLENFLHNHYFKEPERYFISDYLYLFIRRKHKKDYRYINFLSGAFTQTREVSEYLEHFETKAREPGKISFYSVLNVSIKMLFVLYASIYKKRVNKDIQFDEKISEVVTGAGEAVLARNTKNFVRGINSWVYKLRHDFDDNKTMNYILYKDLEIIIRQGTWGDLYFYILSGLRQYLLPDPGIQPSDSVYVQTYLQEKEQTFKEKWTVLWKSLWSGKTKVDLQPLAKKYLDQGVLYFDQGKSCYEFAIDKFDIALGMDNQYAPAYFGKGLLEEQSEEEPPNIDHAIYYYEKAIALDPKLRNAFVNLAGIYFERGNVEKAIRLFDQALQLDPDDFECLYAQGILYQELDKLEEAKSNFERYLSLSADREGKEMEEDRIGAFAYLALIYYGENNLAKSLHYIELLFQKYTDLDLTAPLFDGLREEPDFQALAARYGLS